MTSIPSFQIDRGEGIESCRAEGEDREKRTWGLALCFRELYPNVVSCLVKLSVLLESVTMYRHNYCDSRISRLGNSHEV